MTRPKKPMDVKWLDEMLQIGSDAPPEYATWNESSLLMLCSICAGTLHCDLGFTMDVLPRHQEAAQRLLRGYGEYWKNTPLKQIQAEQREASQRMTAELNRMLSGQGAGADKGGLEPPRRQK